VIEHEPHRVAEPAIDDDDLADADERARAERLARGLPEDVSAALVRRGAAYVLAIREAEAERGARGA